MDDLPPEVLIYIQTVKNFFSKNEGTREYFLSQIDEDIFFKYLGNISQKNFEESGEVMLSEVQFELLRKTLIAMRISAKTVPNPAITAEMKDFAINAANILYAVTNFIAIPAW
jgi:hypothetical protein